MFQCQQEDGLEFPAARKWLYRLASTLDSRFQKLRVSSGVTQDMYDCLKKIIQNSNEESD